MKKPTQVDRLFENFLRELDDFSHNGVLRKMEFPKVWNLMDHYVEQCQGAEAAQRLEARIRLFIDSRVKYSITESDLVISLDVEDSIRMRIQKVFKDKLSQASKFAGIAINWAVLKPIRLFRSTLEPIVAQTVITYSLTVQPVFVQSLGGVEEAPSKAVSSHLVAPVRDRSLQMPKPTAYREDNIKHLMSESPGRREAVESSMLPQAAVIEDIVNEGTKTYRNVTVEIEKRILRTEVVTVSRASAVIEKEGMKLTGYSLRDIGDIQRYMAEQSYRIMNYANGRLDRNGASLRVPVRFTIASNGIIKSIDFLTTVPSTTASRIRTQMLQLRFSAIEARFGDQVVYHSFFL